jgi:hypothetical protein
MRPIHMWHTARTFLVTSQQYGSENVFESVEVKQMWIEHHVAEPYIQLLALQ